MINIPSMQDLLSAGVHFGHQVRRGHPRMDQFIYGARDGVHIIDLASSEEKLKEAAEAAYNLGKDGKVMMVIGTKKQAKDIVKALAQEVETPYLTERWMGGLLTNYEELKKNIKKLSDLKEQQEKGELSRYTKKEQLLISRKLDKFELELGGVSKMDKLPDAIFVVDAVSNDVAVKEANKLGILVIGLCDTNADPHMFDFPVPANDDGIKSIKLISETIIRAYGEGKKKAKVVAQEKEDKEKKEAEDAAVASAALEEASVIEEQIEKAVVQESERKV